MKALAAFLAITGLALLLGAVIPENRGWKQTPGGVIIWIDSTEVHTEIIMPASSPLHDWNRTLRFPGSMQTDRYLSFSWGERDFFLQTPTWADLRPWVALRALFASEASLIHVYAMPEPSGRPIRISEQEFKRLNQHIESQLAPGPSLAGYGARDAFFPAHGRYSLINTCNQWVRDALAAAGVKVGYWTPLPISLMWRFKEQEQVNG